MMKQNSFRSLLLFTLITLYGCASIQSPTGGPKDTTPPRVLSTVPDSAATLVEPEELVIRFDEYIQLRNLTSQLVISPPLENPVLPKIKGTKLVIDLNGNKLDINTTYQFNFGNAIVDNNEGNVLSGFKMVFSTGPYLDSAKFQGRVEDYQTGEGEKETVVMLYKQYRDSTLLLDQPYYITYTNDSGYYNFANLANDTFYAVALADKDRNYQLGKDEKVGVYAQNPIIPEDQDINFRISQNDFNVPTKVKSQNQIGPSKFQIILNEQLSPNDTLELEINYSDHRKQTWIPSYFGITRDTFFFYLPEKNDTQTIVGSMYIYESASNSIDTFEVDITQSVSKQARLPRLKLLQTSLVKTGYPLTIHAGRPISKLDETKCILIEDSVQVTKFKLSSASHPSHFDLVYDFKHSKTYTFISTEGLITDLFGVTNSPDTLKFKTVKDSDVGTLSFSVSKLSSTTHTVYLEIIQGQTVYERFTILPSDSSFKKTLYSIPPGKYGFRYFIDENGNGKWDSGSVIKGLTPEPWIRTKVITEVRGGWSIEDLKLEILPQ